MEKEESLEIHGLFCLIVDDKRMLLVPVETLLKGVAAMR